MRASNSLVVILGLLLALSVSAARVATKRGRARGSENLEHVASQNSSETEQVVDNVADGKSRGKARPICKRLAEGKAQTPATTKIPALSDSFTVVVHCEIAEHVSQALEFAKILTANPLYDALGIPVGGGRETLYQYTVSLSGPAGKKATLRAKSRPVFYGKGDEEMAWIHFGEAKQAKGSFALSASLGKKLDVPTAQLYLVGNTKAILSGTPDWRFAAAVPRKTAELVKALQGFLPGEAGRKFTLKDPDASSSVQVESHSQTLGDSLDRVANSP